MSGFPIQDIREHLQDRPEFNTLLDDEEFKDRELQFAITTTVSAFNSTLPLLDGVLSSWETAPDDLKAILLTGMLAYMYRGKALQQERNRLDYTDGGVQVNTSNRFPTYWQVYTELEAQFKRDAQQWKQAKNIAGGFGFIGSEYSQNYGQFTGTSG